MEQTATDVRSVRDLVLLWGDWPDAYSSMAADLGLEAHVPRDWARRNRLPAEHIDPVVNAAQKRGFHHVTHAFVAKLLREIIDAERAA